MDGCREFKERLPAGYQHTRGRVERRDVTRLGTVACWLCDVVRQAIYKSIRIEHLYEIV